MFAVGLVVPVDVVVLVVVLFVVALCVVVGLVVLVVVGLFVVAVALVVLLVVSIRSGSTSRRCSISNSGSTTSSSSGSPCITIRRSSPSNCGGSHIINTSARTIMVGAQVYLRW